MVRLSRIFLCTLLFSLVASAQDFVGTWDVSLAATVSITHDKRQVDHQTEQRTSTTTLGPGTDSQGTLSISADGTYRLRFWEYGVTYNAPVIDGRWQPVAADDPFAGRGAIELLMAKPTPQAAPADRKWYVFRNQDGSVEARYPPYDGFAKIALRPLGATAAKTGPAKPSPAGGKLPSPKPVACRPATTTATSATPSATTSSKTYTPDQVRAALKGKNLTEVQALLGSPVKEAYGTYSWNNVDRTFPPAAGGNWKSFAIQFGGPGQTVSSVELQYWMVE